MLTDKHKIFAHNTGRTHMLEKYLIEHCSPTLASLKTANLVNISFDNDALLTSSVERINKELQGTGVCILVLKKSQKCALVYAVRKSKLASDLQKNGVAEFLMQYGYGNTDVEACLERLKSRLMYTDEFPHEIGIFLGYPLEDVKGFIDNAGQNSKCTGCWKVYCNECEAIKTFAKFNKCKEIYTKLWLGGRSITKLTVRAV